MIKIFANSLINTYKASSITNNIKFYLYKPSNNKKQTKIEILDQLIYGVNPIEAALNVNKRKFKQLYISDSQAIELSSKAMKLMKLAKELQIPVVFMNKEKMSRLVNNQPHQNIVLKCSPISYRNISKDQKIIFEKGLYVYTDKITDPQNFGAIIRSSLFFGVKSIFSGKKNNCPLNPTVSKASTGALELMDMVLVQNSQNFLKNWKEQGGAILSTQVSSQNKKVYPVQQLTNLMIQDNQDKILIIFGSQGYGVSDHLRKYSDYNIIIQRKGKSQYPYNVVDSLNVNAALTAILFQLSKKIK